jgi:hypothetical protein
MEDDDPIEITNLRPRTNDQGRYADWFAENVEGMYRYLGQPRR